MITKNRTYAKDYVGWWWYYLLYFLLCNIPARMAYSIAAVTGNVMYIILRKDRQYIKGNLRKALKLDDKTLNKYSRSVFRHFCKNLVDFFRFSKLDDNWYRKKTDVVNGRSMDKAYSKQKGVIIISGHLGSWEMGANLIRMAGYPTNAIYLSHKNPKIEKFFISAREKKGLKVILTGGALKGTLKALKRKEVVCIVIDYSYKHVGVEVDFFGEKAVVPVGASIAAISTGAPIIPAFAAREGHDKYHMIYGDEVRYSITGDNEKDIKTIMQSSVKELEKLISKYPDQWTLFRRFWKKD